MSYRKLEGWAKDHPVLIGLIGALFGALLGAVPVGSYLYKSGIAAGAVERDNQWKTKFQSSVDSEVERLLPIKYSTLLEDRVTWCRGQMGEVAATLRRCESEINSLRLEIGRLNSTISALQRRAQILEVFDHFASSAEDLRSRLISPKVADDAEVARARALSLLEYMKRARMTYESWELLFNSLARTLSDKMERGEPISNEELAAFLSYFSSDRERKKTTLQNQIDAINDMIKLNLKN